MILTVFSTRLNAGMEADAEQLGIRLYGLASQMPGFVAYREFQRDGGESVAVVEFESMQDVAAWRNHPVHVEAQRIGRSRLFAQYRVQVCTVEREYDFHFRA